MVRGSRRHRCPQRLTLCLSGTRPGGLSADIAALRSCTVDSVVILGNSQEHTPDLLLVEQPAVLSLAAGTTQQSRLSVCQKGLPLQNSLDISRNRLCNLEDSAF